MIRAPASLGTDVPTGFRPMLKRANLLIGERRRYVFALAFTAAVSGFTEAATLVLVAQVGVSLVRHENTARAHLGPFHPHARLLTLIYVMFGLTIIRLALQFPISHLPARIAADVQASARKRIFHAYTRASWHVQSLDREGQLQETMTSQVMPRAAPTRYATPSILAIPLSHPATGIWNDAKNNGPENTAARKTKNHLGTEKWIGAGKWPGGMLVAERMAMFSRMSHAAPRVIKMRTTVPIHWKFSDAIPRSFPPITKKKNDQ